MCLALRMKRTPAGRTSQERHQSHFGPAAIKREQQTYVVVLDNGEQHYVQAESEFEAAALLRKQMLQRASELNEQTQLDESVFRSVIEYVRQLYDELASERELSSFYCLFCANESATVFSLVQHITEVHKPRIDDGTIDVRQDFRPIVENKILQAQQNRTVITENVQIYQCVQCRQRFRSWDAVSDHLSHCQPPAEPPAPQPAPHPVQPAATTFAAPVAAEPKTEAEDYVPYGCASCGRRWFSIKELSEHIVDCAEDSFHDAWKFLRQQNWIEAPRNQHIVINEDSTNVTLKTTGLWLMPEPAEPQQSNDAMRGFWVLPSSTTIYYENSQGIKREEEPEAKADLFPRSAPPEVQEPAQTSQSYVEPKMELQQYEIEVEVKEQFDPHEMSTTEAQYHQPDVSNDMMFGTELAASESLYEIPTSESSEPLYSLAGSYDNEVELTDTPTQPSRKRGRPRKPQKVEKAKPSPKKPSKRKQTFATLSEDPPKIEAVVNVLPPERKYYLAYDENGVLVPIEQGADAGTMGEQDTLDAAIQSITYGPPDDLFDGMHSSSAIFQQFNIDDLSHLDEPIQAPNQTAAAVECKKRPEFMDSFCKFLQMRQQNKA